MVSTRPPTSKSSSPFSNPLVTDYFTACEFFTLVLAGGLSLESEWQRVSSGLQDSSKYSNNVLVWMILILSLISNSFSLFFKLLGTIPRAPTTNSITVTLMFHSIFSSLARSKYLFIFLLSFIFPLWSARMAKSAWWQVLFSC